MSNATDGESLFEWAEAGSTRLHAQNARRGNGDRAWFERARGRNDRTGGVAGRNELLAFGERPNRSAKMSMAVKAPHII